MPAPPRPGNLAPAPPSLKPSTLAITAGLPAIMTVPEVAALLRHPAKSIASPQFDRGLRPFRTPSGQRRYRLGDIAAFIDSRTQERAR